ncbi:hypothetical protein NDU88_003172 [Pleurodeles waltl]|uniref:Uncharacterized protein n=1 Tax=Pleurodeles waltl TaxID=8319 RepID=A0AAV7LI21_PLEWA|nr:hypothetical protein NDU88_003172 [Pleurodeles waltl]
MARRRRRQLQRISTAEHSRTLGAGPPDLKEGQGRSHAGESCRRGAAMQVSHAAGAPRIAVCREWLGGRRALGPPQGGGRRSWLDLLWGAWSAEMFPEDETLPGGARGS